MSEIIYRTSAVVRGPWFLNQIELEELDVILEEQEAQLQSYAKKKIDQEVLDDVQSEKRLSERYKLPKEINWEEKEKEIRGRLEDSSRFAVERTILMCYVDGKKLSVNSFSEAMRHPESTNSYIEGFIVSLKCAGISCTVKLDDDYQCFSINVYPENLKESQEIFRAFQHWAITHQPPKWQSLWLSAPRLLSLWFFVMAIVFLASFGISENSKFLLKEQAHKMISAGIAQKDSLKAQELMLALLSNYSPPTSTIVVSRWYIWLLGVGSVLAIILCVKPSKIYVGVGKGRIWVRNWRWWLNFVFYTIPASLFLSLLASIIFEKIKPLLGIGA